MITIATWNVNSVRQRLPILLDWLARDKPDIICLQEIKCQDEAFPRMEIEDAGYNIAVFGQKTFNGVAVLSKHPIDEARIAVVRASENDEQARSLEATISLKNGAVRVVSLYCPNGNPLGTDKFTYKQAWNRALIAYAEQQLKNELPLVLAGDYNIIPEEKDCHNPKDWLKDALFQPESRAAYRTLMNLGLTDAIRATTDDDKAYTFWDYQSGAWPKNQGIRIDHLLLSPQAADKLHSASITKDLRALEKPSDHVPVCVTLDLG